MTGAILILMSVSGAGKDTITKLLVTRDPSLRKFPNAATRAIRGGESQGNPYTFISPEEYQARLENSEFISPIRIGDVRYGVPERELRDAVEAGGHLVLHLTKDGVRQVRARFPRVFVAHVQAPSLDEQIRRLRLRGSTDEQIRARLADEEGEHPDPALADIVVVNETNHAHTAAMRIAAAWKEFLARG